jgi:serine/threonine-protein kinase
VLYFCVTGRYPFPDGSAVEKMMAHQFKAPTPVKDLAPSAPDDLVEVIDRLMQKKPQDRFGGADEAAERLLPLAGGQPVNGAYTDLPPQISPRPSSFVPPAPKPTRPSSFILPPANNPAAAAPQPGQFSTSPPLSSRQSSASHTPLRQSSASHAALPPAAPAAAHDSREHQALAQREFTMPPGFVPESGRGPQFGPLAVAAVGLGAMILSYITFLSFNPFK